METIEIRYRTWHKGLPPQPIKLKIPGWAGENRDHSNGARPQPWHCPPFVEGSTYGLELLYPFDTECRVTNVDGKATFEGDWGENPPTGTKWPPFEAFAPGHYGYTSSLDIVGPPGYIIRIEPHPKYYTDHTWSSPCIVPGHIQTEWWPRIFFVVFKTPAPGHVHVFKKHEPYAQILVLPKKVAYEINPMDNAEATERVNLENQIMNAEAKLADHAWTDHKGNHFNDKYKVMARIFNKDGYEGVKQFIEENTKKNHYLVELKLHEETEAKKSSVTHRMKRILVPRHEELQNKNEMQT